MPEKEFENVVRQYKANLYMICYMYAKDSNEANDFFQETLIRLWQGFSQFRGESNINTWLSRICINTCISSLRKKKKHSKTIPLSIDMEFLEENNESGRQLAQMYRLINKLGVLDKALILLWLDNMSYADIAGIMGLSVSNVSVKLMRIKEKLKEMAKG
ncbi:MAG: sigma-70 family RNA polymerase sigma factor [Petrimonas sp.]|nr:sigma-70 family RNA polymerase sigma factor [Petrimonas sp.]